MARGPSAGLLDGGGSPGVEVEAQGRELGSGASSGSRGRPRLAGRGGAREREASRGGDGSAAGSRVR